MTSSADHNTFLLSVSFGLATNNAPFLSCLKMEAVVSEMKRRLEDGDLELELEQKITFLNDGINSERV